MTVGGRIYLKKDNSGLELVKAFAKIPTANIADGTFLCYASKN